MNCFINFFNSTDTMADGALSAIHIAFAGVLLAGAGAPNFATAQELKPHHEAPVASALQCEPKGAEPSAPGIRPTPTFWCSYGEGEVRQRIVRLFDSTKVSLKVENISNLFGIPPMTASSDDLRMADYQTILTGKGGWRMVLWVREGFYPTDQGPPKFVPGLHPKRLDRFENSSRRVDVVLTIAPVEKRTESDCEGIFSFETAAEKAVGWTDATNLVPPSPHGRRGRLFVGANGRRMVPDPPFGDNCQQSLAFWEEPEGSHRFP